MAKKRSFGDKSTRVAMKKGPESVLKMNPFEVRINRKKHDILGQKMEKNERGQPGVSRSRAIQKRKRTLLKEYRNRTKSNNVTDRRVGEGDMGLSHEEKMLQRQIQQVKRRRNKASVYHLEEDELTHLGQAIGDMESFDELQLSSSDEGVDDTENHFGGFLKKKSSSAVTMETGRTRKEVIEEIVAKSKQHKRDRQREREKVDELLETIDDQWNKLKPLMATHTPGPSSRRKESSEFDDFDRYVKELEAQPKAMAKDRLKTEEEVAEEEREKMRALEGERLRRMEGGRGSPRPLANSGDQDVNISAKGVDQRVMLNYCDGEVVLPGGVATLIDSSDEESGDDHMTIDHTPTDDESGDDHMTIDHTPTDEESGDDHMTIDHTPTDEESGDGHMTTDEESADLLNEEGGATVGVVKGGVSPDIQCEDDIKNVAQLLSDRSPVECGIVLDQLLVRCHGNKERQELLFSTLLDYCLMLPMTTVAMETISHLARSLFKAGLASPAHTTTRVMMYLERTCKRYSRSSKKFPSYKDIILFKIIAVLFPTSDFRHLVTTPTIHLMSQCLGQCTVRSFSDVVKYSMICQILLEYIGLSKRFVPELVNYLTALLQAYLPSKEGGCGQQNGCGQLSTLPSVEPQLRVVLCKAISYSGRDKLSLLDLICNGELKGTSVECCSVLCVYLRQLCQLSGLWRALPTYDVIFNPLLTTLARLKENTKSTNYYHELLSKTVSVMEGNISRPRPILQLLRRKPRSIKFFEPSIDFDYQPGKRKYSNKKVAEKFKLKYKHKRELKGAIREIRKDNKFLAKERIEEQQAKDAHRKKKVNQIYGWIQQEQGEGRHEKFKKRKK